MHTFSQIRDADETTLQSDSSMVPQNIGLKFQTGILDRLEFVTLLYLHGFVTFRIIELNLAHSNRVLLLIAVSTPKDTRPNSITSDLKWLPFSGLNSDSTRWSPLSESILVYIGLGPRSEIIRVLLLLSQSLYFHAHRLAIHFLAPLIRFAIQGTATQTIYSHILRTRIFLNYSQGNRFHWTSCGKCFYSLMAPALSLSALLITHVSSLLIDILFRGMTICSGFLTRSESGIRICCQIL